MINLFYNSTSANHWRLRFNDKVLIKYDGFFAGHKLFSLWYHTRGDKTGEFIGHFNTFGGAFWVGIYHGFRLW